MADNDITRKVTSGEKYKHILTTNIVGAQVIADPRPELPGKAYIRFSDQYSILEDARNLPPTQQTKRVTPDVYKRVTKGNQRCFSKEQRGKLVGLHRYNFIMVTEKMTNEAGEDEDVICNIHVYPNSNQRTADLQRVLQIPLDPEDAVVQFHSDGNLDICVFPDQFSFGLQTFFNELEKLGTINDETEIEFPGPDGKVRAVVKTRINMNTVKFGCIQE